MSDFAQTMKDWRRMCKAQNDTTCGECSSCPMGDDGKSCMAVYEDEFETVDFAHIEQTVTEWAAENPVIYPTWKEYLNTLGMWEAASGAMRDDWINTHCIPADIAQKLGIKPKEVDHGAPD